MIKEDKRVNRTISLNVELDNILEVYLLEKGITRTKFVRELLVSRLIADGYMDDSYDLDIRRGRPASGESTYYSERKYFDGLSFADIEEYLSGVCLEGRGCPTCGKVRKKPYRVLTHVRGDFVYMLPKVFSHVSTGSINVCVKCSLGIKNTFREFKEVVLLGRAD